jgi:spermidine/putrescine transport system substrate-binding protein
VTEPPEPPRGITRRSLVRRASAAALATGAAGVLAGCENTTTPVGATGVGGAGGKGLLGDPTAGGPVDAVGIPLSRRDYPVTLPRLGEAVKSSVKVEKGGELHVYNYADYLNPAVLKAFGKENGVSVRVTTFNTLDEAYAKLANGLEADVVFLAPDRLSKWVGGRLLAPLNLELIPNLEKTVWPELHSPSYDVGSRYSIPYTTYTTGIGWRNDLLGFDPSKLDQPWDAFWKAKKAQGRVGILDDNREAIGMALMRRGITDLNTEDPKVIAQARADLEELNDLVRVKVTISGYETLPIGRTWMNQNWSGDLITAVIGYLPKGTKPDVLSYWSQEAGGPVFNDIMTVSAKAQKPVLAHKFINYLLDDKVAYENFVGYVGYQPPITSIDPDEIVTKGIIPKELSTAVITREAYANGNAYLALTAKGDQTWDRAWQGFRNG